jgi:cyclic pyranopterin phosphate synthase
MPTKPFSWVPREKLLKFEELFLFVKVAIDEGIKKIRITGGEPLLREDLHKFLFMIFEYQPDIDLALTTNGFLLKETAKLLKDSGLKRVNISLDSLDKATAHNIAQKDVLKNILDGIDEALKVGLKIKINNVPMKNINDHELLDILEYGIKNNITVRYIEYMENSFANQKIEGISSSEILEKIQKKYKISDLGFDSTSPSHYYKIESLNYKFGIIEPHSDDFCSTCNRIRLTAEGFLIPCLYFDEAQSIAEFVKKGDIINATNVLKDVIKNKPEKNRWSESTETNEVSSRAFYETGG